MTWFIVIIWANISLIWERSFLLFFSQIKNQAQLDAALAFLSTVGPEPFNLNEFEEVCGVGKIVIIAITSNDVYCGGV